MASSAKVPQIHPFLNSSVILDISNGVFDTIKTMAHSTCVCDKSFFETSWKSPTSYSVNLDIESAQYKGQILFHFSKKSLYEAYKKIVSLEADEDTPNEQLLDCLAEISNMAYGSAKTKLNLDGYSFKMSMPHPLKTEDVKLSVSKFPNIIVPFKLFDEDCYIQMVIA